MADESHKQIILNSMQYMVDSNRCRIYAFVIMPNHIHMILDLNDKEETIFQRDFLKFTAQSCIRKMKEFNDPLLSKISSTQNDRNLHFWERRPLWLTIRSEYALLMKMQYIHMNPVKSKKVECREAAGYKWSSAESYLSGKMIYPFLSVLYSPSVFMQKLEELVE